MSAEILDEIADWDVRNQLRRAVNEAKAAVEQSKRPRCGKCDWWMKSRDCPEEHNVNGFSRGPSTDSMTALSCPKFEWSKQALEFTKMLEDEQAQTERATSFEELPKRV